MNSKKEIRRKFREVCLKRDKLSCVMCGLKKKSFEEAEEFFDVHHIQDRSLMPHGGYVAANGITLCPECHEKAEEFHRTGTPLPNYSPEELFNKISSSLEKAIQDSERLK